MTHLRRARLFSLFFLAAMAAGCCKTLECESRRMASHLLECNQDAVCLSEPTPAEEAGVLRRAQGCGRSVMLECVMMGSGLVYSSEQKEESHRSQVPTEFQDPHWRCWEHVEGISHEDERTSPGE
ncbi:MAG: hypothetical protein JXR96_27915 [Deltaproteobacteria bacterium]|nr:hypothetical protein [Deltaproteobacteria bacterium]